MTQIIVTQDHALDRVRKTILQRTALNGLPRGDTKRAGILVHMESRNPEDPLDFDYLVRPGIATRCNAMAIVRMIALVKVRSIQEKSRKPY